MTNPDRRSLDAKISPHLFREIPKRLVELALEIELNGNEKEQSIKVGIMQEIVFISIFIWRIGSFPVPFYCIQLISKRATQQWQTILICDILVNFNIHFPVFVTIQTLQTVDFWDDNKAQDGVHSFYIQFTAIKFHIFILVDQCIFFE